MSDELTVTINFEDKDGTRVLVHLPWVAERRLKDYLRSSVLRGRGLLHVATRSKVVDQRGLKVRLTRSLSPGETIFLMSRM